jgi:hypothetical protein
MLPQLYKKNKYLQQFETKSKPKQRVLSKEKSSPPTEVRSQVSTKPSTLTKKFNNVETSDETSPAPVARVVGTGFAPPSPTENKKKGISCTFIKCESINGM